MSANDLKLSMTYRWLNLSEDGLLKPAKDGWGEDLPICSERYGTKAEAIEAYVNLVSSRNAKIPWRLVLLEEHTVSFNWDE